MLIRMSWRNQNDYTHVGGFHQPPSENITNSGVLTTSKNTNCFRSESADVTFSKSDILFLDFTKEETLQETLQRFLIYNKAKTVKFGNIVISNMPVITICTDDRLLWKDEKQFLKIDRKLWMLLWQGWGYLKSIISRVVTGCNFLCGQEARMVTSHGCLLFSVKTNLTLLILDPYFLSDMSFVVMFQTGLFR